MGIFSKLLIAAPLLIMLVSCLEASEDTSSQSNNNENLTGTISKQWKLTEIFTDTNSVEMNINIHTYYSTSMIENEKPSELELIDFQNEIQLVAAEVLSNYTYIEVLEAKRESIEVEIENILHSKYNEYPIKFEFIELYDVSVSEELYQVYLRNDSLQE